LNIFVVVCHLSGSELEREKTIEIDQVKQEKEEKLFVYRE
jgi:hypothetical protein